MIPPLSRGQQRASRPCAWQGLRESASFRNAMSQRMKMWDAVSIIHGYKDWYKLHGLPNLSDFTMNCVTSKWHHLALKCLGLVTFGYEHPKRKIGSTNILLIRHIRVSVETISSIVPKISKETWSCIWLDVMWWHLICVNSWIKHSTRAWGEIAVDLQITAVSRITTCCQSQVPPENNTIAAIAIRTLWRLVCRWKSSKYLMRKYQFYIVHWHDSHWLHEECSEKC